MIAAILTPLPPAGGSQHPSADWIVDGTELVENRAIALHGNLTVRAGGKLTLRNVELTVAASPDGARGILVEAGGSLTVTGGSVRPADPGTRIAFVARGEKLLIDGANVSGVGSCTTHAIQCVSAAPERSGIVVDTPGATIRDSHVTRGGVALIIRSDDARVTGNIVENNDRCALYVTGDRATIEGNVLRQSYRGFLDRTCVVEMEGADDTAIIGNDLREDPFPPSVESVPDPQGINAHDSDGLLIENNTIAAYRPVHLFETTNTRILGNMIHAGEVGVFLQGGANNRVEGNTILGDGWDGGTGPTNVLSISSQIGSVVADNRLVMHRGLGLDVIVLNQFFDGHVLNNVIEAGFDAYREDPNGTEGAEALILMHSSGNTIRGNRLGVAWGGMFLLAADHNLVEGNEIHGLRGVTAVASRGNTIVNNNILDRPRGSFDDGANSWSRGAEGNHWIADEGEERPRPIPPRGADAAPRARPVEIVRWPVPAYDALPAEATPKKRDSAVLETSLLEDQTTEITHGVIRPPFGESRLVIRNATLVLGRLGPVTIGAVDLVVESSRLVMATPGYGFSFGAHGDRFVVRDSLVEGAGWGDPAPRELVLENSTVTNTVAIGIFSAARAIETVRIVNNTFSGLLIPLYVGAVGSANVSGNRISGSIHTAILVNDIPPTYKDRMREIVVSDNDVRRVWKAPAIVVGYNDVDLDRALVSRNHVGDSWAGFTGGGKGLVLTLNTFCGNRHMQASSSPEARWHDAGLGNHWSDYAGEDVDGDGIGDAPYRRGGVTDPFPLMEPATSVNCGPPPTPEPDDPSPGETPPEVVTSEPPGTRGGPSASDRGAQSREAPGTPVVGGVVAIAAVAMLIAGRRWRPRADEGPIPRPDGARAGRVRRTHPP